MGSTPAREVRKEIFEINDNGVFPNPENLTLITALESQTIVKILVNLSFYSSEITLNIETRFAVLIAKTKGTVIMATATLGDALITPKPAVLARSNGRVVNLSGINAGGFVTYEWNEMLNVKRKMKRGEFLYLSQFLAGSNTAILHRFGHITMWILE